MNDFNPARRKLSAFFSVLSAALYVGSFLMPVVAIGSDPPCLGYAAFLMALLYPIVLAFFAFPMGLLGLLMWFPCWLANVAYWSALHRSQKGETRKAASRSGLGVVLGLTIVPALGLWPTRFQIGFWCWLGSMALLTVGAGIATDRRWKQGKVKVWEDVRTWEDERPTRMVSGEARR